ncbi:hypothetical protein HPB52_014881 [Rhipicephalus sanguineus]|uniref:Uncharacterized protein n=1 Tax=Rhipicephalus sanguineus TaxID=34632 RepID=A0A9D4SYX5_RHISA|nr:hypothetical protein HPB52_014881 [Rhipicephalus sanguineus]
MLIFRDAVAQHFRKGTLAAAMPPHFWIPATWQSCIRATDVQYLLAPHFCAKWRGCSTPTASSASKKAVASNLVQTRLLGFRLCSVFPTLADVIKQRRLRFRTTQCGPSPDRKRRLPGVQKQDRGGSGPPEMGHLT